MRRAVTLHSIVKRKVQYGAGEENPALGAACRRPCTCPVSSGESNGMTRIVAPGLGIDLLLAVSAIAAPRRHQEAAFLVEDGLELVVRVGESACSPHGSRARVGRASAGSRPAAAGSSPPATSGRSSACPGRLAVRARPGWRPRRADPISSRNGTPRSSQWLYLKPGFSSRQSVLKRSGPDAVWTDARECSRISMAAATQCTLIFAAKDGHDGQLNRRYVGRQDKARVVAVGHDHGADHARRKAPRRAIGVLELLSRSRNSMPAALAKFCPSMWLVPA